MGVIVQLRHYDVQVEFSTICSVLKRLSACESQAAFRFWKFRHEGETTQKPE